MRPLLSAAAAGLLRALMARAGEARDRILLIEFRSTDWQSLTFSGERHQFRLRLMAPEADILCAQLTGGIGNSEWQVPGQIVADILVTGTPETLADGSILLDIEALTVDE